MAYSLTGMLKVQKKSARFCEGGLPNEPKKQKHQQCDRLQTLRLQ